MSPTLNAILIAMHARNWSASDLARKAGISPDSAERITKGRGNPTLETLDAVFKALDLNVGSTREPDGELRLAEVMSDDLGPHFDRTAKIQALYKLRYVLLTKEGKPLTQKQIAQLAKVSESTVSRALRYQKARPPRRDGARRSRSGAVR